MVEAFHLSLFAGTLCQSAIGIIRQLEQFRRAIIAKLAPGVGIEELRKKQIGERRVVESRMITASSFPTEIINYNGQVI